MHWYNKKAEAPAFNVIIYAILGLVFLAMLIGVLIVFQDELLNKESAVQTGCWLTNTIKCSGGLFKGMPSLCFSETLEDPITEEKFAGLLRDTYWMYKQGECDLDTMEDDVYPVYAFQVSKDIDLDKFLNSLAQRKDGEIKKNLDIAKSDLAYLEEGTYYQTLCFDTEDKEGIANRKLVKNKQYYIIYYDDVEIIDYKIFREKSDAILISTDPSSDKGHFEDLLVTFPSPLAGIIQTPIVLSKTDEERGCLVYGASPNE
ncbi:MAG: hypothetical protein Q8R18_04895 [bacterium]|nr:hypothetical protein [bacterium]